MNDLGRLLYTLFCVATAMIGYERHGSIFWAILDFIFTPLVWIKWLIMHQISINLIKETFSFFI